MCSPFVDCTAKGVIYLWLCECSSYYIGKTIRPFQVVVIYYHLLADIVLLSMNINQSKCFSQLWITCIRVPEAVIMIGWLC